MWIKDEKTYVIGGLVIVALAVILGLTKFKLPEKNVSLQPSSTQNTNTMAATYPFTGQLTDADITNKQARITTAKGDIVLKLEPATAPLAVTNFVYLANQGYYDGIKWHRVVRETIDIIQGGDPNTKISDDPTQWGFGGPGYTFADEPVVGTYTEGIVAMANAGPNTNGSQFFINTGDNSQKFAPNYTIFGRVTAGMDVAKAIEAGDVMTKVVIEDAA